MIYYFFNTYYQKLGTFCLHYILKTFFAWSTIIKCLWNRLIDCNIDNLMTVAMNELISEFPEEQVIGVQV